MKNRLPLMLRVIAAIALTAAASGCNNNGVGTPQTGNLHGRVALFDENGIIQSDFSNVTVRAEGTGYSATSDANGDWVIRGLPSGTYMITYNKAGFIADTMAGYPFVGGGDAYIWLQRPKAYIRMDAMPSFTIPSISVSPMDSALAVTLQFTPTSQTTYKRFATLGISMDSPANANSARMPYIQNVVAPPGSLSYQATIELWRLKFLLQPGTRYYMVAYPANTTLTMLLNPLSVTDQYNPTNVTPTSSEVSFVMPQVP
ncbi:MAG: carboxypeptidase regulatory-like domain-containing protein [Bacteroidetes bacterium]|nr:carboxypeptidase regulatory-like domain-containing protein [Bacteroidota bacterium]